MTMTDTVTVTIDGKDQEVEIRDLSAFEVFLVIAQMPDPDEHEDDMSINVDDVERMFNIIGMCTDLTEDELYSIDKIEDVTKLMEASSKSIEESAGGGRQNRDFRFDNTNNPFGDLDINEDGSVDPDDWR